ncbi:class I SAM-dependent methyltransferase [Yoonia sp.]|uniref:class I SAM-dependent methyltransferase n=1 Tax=Yoonia sp. TaxID=2212373 RepID=UPI002FD9705E
MSDAKFWDRAAEKYAASPIKDMQAYQDTLDRARHYLRPGDHLLEVGCGTGTTALKLAPALRHITATDVSGGMLAFGERKKAAQGVGNVTFLQSEIMQPVPGAPFDAIFASSILHLVDDLDAALGHLFAQVKPGGYVISKTACLKNMAVFIPPMIRVMQMIGKAPHVLVFSRDELDQAFRKAGFRLVETGHFGKNRYTHFVVAQRP